MSSVQTIQRSRFAILVALGFLSSLWALFQWGELIAARAGATPFCSLGKGLDCAAVWDSPFARAVHDVTRVPIAGWGLVWGVVAFALSLAVLTDDARLTRGLSAALRATALVGVASVGGLFAATLVAKALCLGCLGTYVVVLAWSMLAWTQTAATGFGAAGRGAVVSGGIALATYAVLFVPGTRTPHATTDLGKSAMQALGAATQPPAQPTATAPATATTDRFSGAGTGDATRDEQLVKFMQALEPEARQMMSNLLAAYEASPVVVPPDGRLRIGPADAKVKFVDFTDPLCGHCAALHDTLEEMHKFVAADAFSIEPHFFPLDGACNPEVTRKWDTDIRCQAVRAQLCVDDVAQFAAFQSSVFENQQGLTTDKLIALAATVLPGKKFQDCQTSPKTQALMDDDIAAAMALHLEGTPLVLLNGKEVQPFGPLLFALVLTGGASKHPAFAGLPVPVVAAPH